MTFEDGRRQTVPYPCFDGAVSSHTSAQACSLSLLVWMGILVIAALCATLLPAPARAQSTEPTTTITATTPITISLASLANLTYTLSSVSGAPIRLADGVFVDVERGATSALLPDLVALGDLDDDGLLDAIVVLTTTIGESSFVELAAVVQRDGAAINVANVTLGDRVQVSSTAVADGVVTVALTVHAPGDLLCCPTLPAVRAFRLRNDQLVDAPQPGPGRLYPFRMGGRYAYINEFGRLVTRPEFVFAGEFSEGMALVSYDGQNFGFIDQTGRMVIQPNFLFATPFASGRSLAAIPTNDERIAEAVFIDRRGKNIFGDKTFPYARAFSEGLAAVRDENRKFGFIDARGNLVIPQQFDDALPFTEGLAPVLVDGQVGYIDRRGQMVVQPQFESAFDFHEGLAVVILGGLSGYINQRGEFVIPPQFERARNFSEGLAAVKVGDNEAYIDASGAIVIDMPEFSDAHDFSEGLAAVKIGDLYGYIDQTGAVAIQPIFTRAENFQQGVAVVETAGFWGLITPDGSWLVEVEQAPLPGAALIGDASAAVSAVITQSLTSTVTTPGDALFLGATEIIYYTPQIAPESRMGVCSGNSELFPSLTAWRCTVDGELFDPCLTAVDGATLACASDPSTAAPGFNLILESPLPSPFVPQVIFPGALAFQLPSGAICRWNSGTAIVAEGRRVNYVCSDLTQLLGEIDKSQPLWTIEEVTLSNDGLGNYRVDSSRAVPIVRVWQPQ